jgi:hypothetical protein
MKSILGVILKVLAAAIYLQFISTQLFTIPCQPAWAE